MNIQAEAKFKAAKERLVLSPDDLATLKQFAEAARGFDKRDDAVAAMKAAYQRRPTPELYSELRSICTYPEFQAIAQPPEHPDAKPPLQAGTGAEILPRKRFPLLLDQVILYPVEDGLSVFILLCCSFMLALSNVLWNYAGLLGMAASVILAGYPFAYFWSVVTASGMGEKRTRGWPDISNPNELGEAFFRWVMVSVACFGPAVLFLIYPLFSGEPLQMFNVIGAIVLGLLGVCYYPMALMVAGFTGDMVQVLNVPSAVRSIAKIPGDYLICLGFFVGTYIVVVILEIILHVMAAGSNPPMYVALTFFARVIDTYLVMVQMRTVGLLYYSREKDLGWFQ